MRLTSLLAGLLLLAAPSLAQTTQRVYPINATQIAVADADGKPVSLLPASQVAYFFGPDEIQMRLGTASTFYKPNQFLRQNGTPYGATIVGAGLRWQTTLQQAGQSLAGGTALSPADVAGAVSTYLGSLTTTSGTSTGPNIQLAGGQRVNAKINPNGVVQVWQTWDIRPITWAANAPLIYSTKIYPVSNTNRTDDIRLFGATSAGGIDKGQSRVDQAQTLTASTVNTFTVNTTMPGDTARYVQVFVGLVPANTSAEAVFYLGGSTLSFNGQPATLVGTQLFNATAPDAANSVTEIPNTGTTTTTGGVTVVNTVPGGGTSRLTGKKVVWFGNSLIAGQGIPHAQTWSGLITARYGMTEVNLGISGSTVGEWSRDATTTANSYVNRLGAIPADADYIVFEGLTNDFVDNKVPLGTPASTDKNTVYGALKFIIPTVLASNPTSKLSFVSPMNFMGPGDTALRAYVDALKEVCSWWGVPVLDLYRNAGFSAAIPAQRSAYFSPDGVHTNAPGNVALSYKVDAFLQSQ